MENDNNILDDAPAIITLTDVEGNQVDFELLDSVDYQNVEYLVLIDPDPDATEVVILEVEPHADGTEEYLTVEDEAVTTAVFGIFQERNKNFYTFEE